MENAAVNPYLIAAVGVVPALIAPMFMVLLQNWAKSKEKAQDAQIKKDEKDADNLRQDEMERRSIARSEKAAADAQRALDQAAEVAHKAEEGVKVVAVKAEETARLLVQNNKIATERAQKTEIALKEIHTLVNSQLTAALDASLVAIEAMLVVMNQNKAMKKTLNIAFTDADAVAMKSAEDKIAELKAVLNDRLKQTAIVATNAAVAAAVAVEVAKDTK